MQYFNYELIPNRVKTHDSEDQLRETLNCEIYPVLFFEYTDCTSAER